MAKLSLGQLVQRRKKEVELCPSQSQPSASSSIALGRLCPCLRPLGCSLAPDEVAPESIYI